MPPPIRPRRPPPRPCGASSPTCRPTAISPACGRRSRPTAAARRSSSAALSSSDAFKSAVTGISLSVQQVVTGGPDGDKSYYMQIDNGEPKIALGEAQTPDVTLTQDYETAVAIAKGELNAQNAFMTGK